MVRYQFFFLSGFSFTDSDNTQYSRRREGNIFCSTLPLPSIHEHSQFIFLLVFTRLLTLWNYHLIDWWRVLIFACLHDDVDSRFVLQQFDTRNGWTQTSSTLALQTNQASKCASHSNDDFKKCTIFSKELSSFSWDKEEIR